MAKKTLNIIETAYRAVMEEQDDTTLWLLAAMKGAGADHTIVLRGNAVNYAVSGQETTPLKVGTWQQTHAPRMDRDLLDVMENRGMAVYAIEEDLAERGIGKQELVSGVKLLPRKRLAGLMAEFAIVSHW